MIRNEQCYKDLHEEMWEWLADHPEKDKDDWPRWKDLPLDIREGGFRCFACYWTEYLNSSDTVFCEICPCWTYTGDYFMCEKPESPYMLWEELDNETEGYLEMRTKYALEIKNRWK